MNHLANTLTFNGKRAYKISKVLIFRSFYFLCKKYQMTFSTQYFKNSCSWTVGKFREHHICACAAVALTVIAGAM